MSMGLRGAGSFGPLWCALFLPGRINKKFALYAIFAGPLFVLIGKFILPKYINSLFLGVGISLLIMVIGYFVNEKKGMTQNREA